MSLDKKVVIVTGGAGGVGEALNRAFLRNGAKVCACDINVEQGTKLVQELKKEFGAKNVIFSKCDVTNEENFEGVFNECEKEWGTVDIIINNAGIYSKDHMTTMAVNYGGLVIGTELAYKKLGKHNGGKGGQVVNIASVAGMCGFPLLPYYAASKAAAAQYSRCMGHKFNYNYSGVSVLCLCPDAVDTPFTSVESCLKGSLNSYTDAAIKIMVPNLTEKDKLKPMEVAEAVLRLIRENKTGSVLVAEPGVESRYVDPPISTEYV